MKKTILYIFLSTIFLTSPINAEKLEDKTYEELMAEFLILDKKEKELEARLKIEKAKTLAEKEETRSAIEVNKKLDEVLNILSK
jgi:hypothetical protein